MWSLTSAILLVGVCLAVALLRAPLTVAMALHGALMITAWGALLPLGAIVARYFKVTPGQDFPAVCDNPFWWDWHRRLQYGGMALATVAFAIIVRDAGLCMPTLHGWCGLVVMSLGWLQVVSTLFRGNKGGPTGQGADPADPATWRGDHYDMTLRRRRFEVWHKQAGWAVLIFAAVTILLGIDLAGAPTWLLALAGGLQAALALAIVDSAWRRRWRDTYVALWGPDSMHPGNRSLSGPPSRRPRER